MKYFLYVLIYLFLLVLHLPSSQTTYAVDTVLTHAYFCKEIDCPTLLLSLFDTYPQAQCVFYDLDEQRILDYLSSSTQEIYVYEKTLSPEQTPRFQPLKSEGLLHHKFCIFNDTVLTGSWNPTLRGSYLNDNYVVLFTHPAIANIYASELKNLKKQKSFSPLALTTNTSTYDFYFCPQHNCEQKILNEIARTTTSVQLLSFTFTSTALEEALRQQLSAGITVTIVQEQRQAHLSESDERLAAAGASIRYDNNPYTMHGKVWILDNNTLILGSYNPTKAATTKNNENLIIIKNDTALLEAFQREFKRIWDESAS